MKRVLEAALLSATEPLTVLQLKRLFAGEVDADNIRKVLDELKGEWAERSIELTTVASGWRFRVKPDYQKFLDRISTEKPPRYSRAVLETLAIIAYRQPVTRGDIEEVRGVAVSPPTLNALIERGWVEIVGHRETPGRPAIFATTKKFLDDLNLRSLEELPPLEELQSALERPPNLVALEAASPPPEEESPQEPIRPTSPNPPTPRSKPMRDRPHPNHKLEWPGGVVPEWAKPQQNANKRRGKGPGGGERQGGSSPSKRERLQKVMAQSGHGSRRNIEILIAQGHITINGQVAKLGDSVGPGDKVKLDGKLLHLRYGEPLPRVLLYHKTAGEIVTRDDPEKRPTVFDKLPKVNGGRWVSVGRLDFNTEGLLIFTTSGELANRLTHPRFEVEREYAVRVMGELTEEQRSKLLTGVDIDGESCKFDSLEDRGGEGSNHWYHVILREGKNREVRRMMEAVGLMVSRLMRVRFGSVELPGHIKRGMMREMEEAQIQDLLTFAGMNEPPAGRPPTRMKKTSSTTSATA